MMAFIRASRLLYEPLGEHIPEYVIAQQIALPEFPRPRLSDYYCEQRDRVDNDRLLRHCLPGERSLGMRCAEVHHKRPKRSAARPKNRRLPREPSFTATPRPIRSAR
jgi:hypothetical protein